MGRKIGKKRSKALDFRLSAVHGGFSCFRDAVMLTPYQWRNYLSSVKSPDNSEVKE